MWKISRNLYSILCLYSILIYNIALGIVYHSPNSDAKNSRRLFCLLRDTARLYPSNLFIVGDLIFQM